MRSKHTLTPFEQALLDASLEEFADIPESEEEIDISPSPAFEAKSRKLIQDSQRKVWHYTNTAVKRIILVAAIVALLATTAMAVPAIREALIQFFVHDEVTHYEFTFDSETLADAPKRIETVYMPTYIPEGYTEIMQDYCVAGVSGAWQKDDDFNYIIYDQYSIPEHPEDGNWLGLNSERVVASGTVLVDGYEVFYSEDGDFLHWAWTDYQYFYMLGVSVNLPEYADEIKQIFLSIQEIPNAVIHE